MGEDNGGSLGPNPGRREVGRGGIRCLGPNPGVWGREGAVSGPIGTVPDQELTWLSGPKS